MKNYSTAIFVISDAVRAVRVELAVGDILTAPLGNKFLASTLNAVDDPQAIAVGDFNGDTFGDLAVANGSTRILSLILSDGTETEYQDTINIELGKSANGKGAG